ncbi:hypothetical protein ACHQM5_000795 [Ranunculus cassubicifolius]
MNPGKVPIELSRLSNLESILIARIHPMMSVYRVKGQQYKYSGNVINFAQDVNMVANVLPCRPADLSALLIVKRTGPNAEKEFVVRREYVRQALLWLKDNHRYYRDISIDITIVEELPENGVPQDLPNIEEVEQERNNGENNQQQITGERGPTELQEEDLHIDQFEGAGTFALTGNTL